MADPGTGAWCRVQGLVTRRHGEKEGEGNLKEVMRPGLRIREGYVGEATPPALRCSFHFLGGSGLFRGFQV